ncbi:MAG: hypothetical protein AAB110_03700, partial [Candidatus Desantisbacteria bacterium]
MMGKGALGMSFCKRYWLFLVLGILMGCSDNSDKRMQQKELAARNTEIREEMVVVGNYRLQLVKDTLFYSRQGEDEEKRIELNMPYPQQTQFHRDIESKKVRVVRAHGVDVVLVESYKRINDIDCDTCIKALLIIDKGVFLSKKTQG